MKKMNKLILGTGMHRLIVGKIVSKDKPWEDMFEEYKNKTIIDFTTTLKKPFRIHFEGGNNVIFKGVVEDFEENDYGFWIETTDMLWRLDKVSDNDRRVGFTYEF